MGWLWQHWWWSHWCLLLLLFIALRKKGVMFYNSWMWGAYTGIPHVLVMVVYKFAHILAAPFYYGCGHPGVYHGHQVWTQPDWSIHWYFVVTWVKNTDIGWLHDGSGIFVCHGGSVGCRINCGCIGHPWMCGAVCCSFGHSPFICMGNVFVLALDLLLSLVVLPGLLHRGLVQPGLCRMGLVGNVAVAMLPLHCYCNDGICCQNRVIRSK